MCWSVSLYPPHGVCERATLTRYVTFIARGVYCACRSLMGNNPNTISSGCSFYGALPPMMTPGKFPGQLPPSSFLWTPLNERENPSPDPLKKTCSQIQAVFISQHYSSWNFFFFNYGTLPKIICLALSCCLPPVLHCLEKKIASSMAGLTCSILRCINST